MMIYKQGVNEYAPFYKVEKSGLMENVRAKKRREWKENRSNIGKKNIN